LRINPTGLGLPVSVHVCEGEVVFRVISCGKGEGRERGRERKMETETEREREMEREGEREREREIESGKEMEIEWGKSVGQDVEEKHRYATTNSSGSVGGWVGRSVAFAGTDVHRR